MTDGKNLIGSIFGRLKVVEKANLPNKRVAYWICECTCGNLRTVSESDLLRGHIKSCGCPKQKENLINRKFGSWTVIDYAENLNGTIAWLCQCSCENKTIKIVNASSLKSGDSKSCGCLNKRMDDLTGKHFGNWIVLNRDDSISKSAETRWICECQCKNKILKSVSGKTLKNGTSKSCGCLSSEHSIKHHLATSRIYGIFKGMKQRCYNNNDTAFKYYGGRGIKVCAEWLDKETGFVNFYNWSIENGYTDDLTIDRIDSNGNYEPDNCRWATAKEQANNKRNTIYVVIKGEKKKLDEWSSISGINKSTIRKRIRKGWREDDLLMPVKIENKGDDAHENF